MATEQQSHNLSVFDNGGEGRPVVLIHGWPLSHVSWSAQTEALTEAGYRVVAYDRRGFGKSDPGDAYDYDALTDDLANVIDDLDLTDVTLVGFSMGGGEVARYVSRHGQEKLHSVVFASAIPPALLQSDSNPDGPLDEESATQLRKGLEHDRDGFLDEFTTNLFTANGELKVAEEKRQEALAIAQQSNQEAALLCMDAWATDFRNDIEQVTVPTLVIHGDSDAIVPFEGSGRRTHARDRGQRPGRHRGRPARHQRQPRARVQRGAADVPGEVGGPYDRGTAVWSGFPRVRRSSFISASYRCRLPSTRLSRALASSSLKSR